mmetsp:Transcript_25555/g.52545  ORF Transcript_25555/g.52545 Transcript_25555/m.52545 type:complete len:228 (+) Transcript_25555:35-718(+)
MPGPLAATLRPRRASFGTVEWCAESETTVGGSSRTSTVDPLAQTQIGSFYANATVNSSEGTQSRRAHRPATPPASFPARRHFRPMSARAAREGRRLGDASESCVPTISAQSSASSASTPRQTVLATAAIPGYTGHIPNKDIEVCGGTFTVESMAAAAIRTRRQRCRTSVFSKQLADGRTYAQGFSEQLGLEFTSTLRNYQPWTQPAAGVTHSFERYSRAARPICFVR